MSVHQIEQYYIHEDVTAMNSVGRLKLTSLLRENDIHDYELQNDGSLVVDGFEDKVMARAINELILDLLAKYSEPITQK